MFEKFKEIKNNIFLSITNKKAIEKIEEINKKREKNGKAPLTKVEEERVKRNIARKAAVRATIIGVAVTMFGAGMGTPKLIDAGKEHFAKEVTVDAEKTDKTIQVKNFNERKELWLNENIKVDLDEVNQNEKLEQEVDAVFERINNSNDRIKAGTDYIKQLYIDEYNEKNTDNKTIDDVKIGKAYNDALDENPQFLLYKDYAENGDEIIRRVRQGEEVDDNMIPLPGGTYLSTNDWIVAVSVYENFDDGEKNKLSEDMFTLTENGYVPVYDMDEQVLEAGNLITENDMAGVINYFYDYYNEHANDFGQVEELRQGAKEKLTEYEKSKEKKIRNRILKADNSNKTNEVDDELGL